MVLKKVHFILLKGNDIDQLSKYVKLLVVFRFMFIIVFAMRTRQKKEGCRNEAYTEVNSNELKLFFACNKGE